MLTLLTIVLRNASVKNKEKLQRGICKVLHTQGRTEKKVVRFLPAAASQSSANTAGQTNFRNLSVMPSTSNNFIFRQLFDRESCTYTYLLADGASKNAILIDSVYELVDRDVQIIKELGLNLVFAANTHVHADHVTGTGLLKQRLPECKSLISQITSAKADVYVNHGDKINVGDIEIEVRSTPGHTNGCITYVCHREAMAFTGDALLVRGCGRTDFQQGDASRLYDSVHSQILSLPDETKLYPAHDYKGFSVTTVGEEKRYNPRLTRSRDEFINIMKNLNLPYPKQIDVAVPSNMVCGDQELVEDIRRKVAEKSKNSS